MDTTDFAQRIRLNLAQSHAQLQRSVCPLYGADIRGLPRLIGSGVLIKVASRSIMATAGHVLDENEHSNFYVAGRHELVELEGSMHSSVAPQAGREGDNIDLGFIILSDRLATELGQRFTFLSAEAIDAQDLPLAHQLYAFIGYPVTLNKARLGMKIKLTGAMITARPIAPQDYHLLGLHPWVHFAGYFDRQVIINTEERIVTAPHPRGISGGGIWGLGKSSDLLTGSGFARLIGLALEWRRGRKVLVGVRISVLVATLLECYPDLAPDLQKPNLVGVALTLRDD